MTIDIKFGAERSPEIFSGIAEKYAKKIKLDSEKNPKGKNKNTQIRKFYDELILWESKVNIPVFSQAERGKKYKELEPFIKMLKAKVAYSKGRGHVDDDFKNIFDKCIDEIESPETLKEAKLFMEALIGYCKTYKERN